MVLFPAVIPVTAPVKCQFITGFEESLGGFLNFPEGFFISLPGFMSFFFKFVLRVECMICFADALFSWGSGRRCKPSRGSRSLLWAQ